MKAPLFDFFFLSDDGNLSSLLTYHSDYLAVRLLFCPAQQSFSYAIYHRFVLLAHHRPPSFIRHWFALLADLFGIETPCWSNASSLHRRFFLRPRSTTLAISCFLLTIFRWLLQWHHVFVWLISHGCRGHRWHCTMCHL